MNLNPIRRIVDPEYPALDEVLADRRGFLKKIGLVAGVVLSGAALAGCEKTEQPPPQRPPGEASVATPVKDPPLQPAQPDLKTPGAGDEPPERAMGEAMAPEQPEPPEQLRGKIAMPAKPDPGVPEVPPAAK